MSGLHFIRAWRRETINRLRFIVSRADKSISNLIKNRRMTRFRTLDAKLRLFQRNHGVRINAGREPNVGPYDGVMADDGVAAQDSGIGIDHDIVLQRRMPFHAANDVACFIPWKAESAQGHAL